MTAAEAKADSDVEVLRLSSSPIALSGLVGIGSFWGLQVVAQVFPWRTLVLTLLVLNLALARSQAPVLLPLVLVFALASSALEVSRRRVFVTSTCIVRQTGLFRARQRRLPLTEVHGIRVTYPWMGQSLDVGNIEFEASPGGFTFMGIGKPETIAARINALCDEAIAQKQRPRG